MSSFTGWSADGANVLANSLSNLGQQFGQAFERQGKLQSAQQIGRNISSNDLKGAMQQAFDSGDVELGLKLYKQADEQKWLSELGPQLYGGGSTLSPIAPNAGQQGSPMSLPGGPTRGDINRNPGNIESGPFAQSQPGYVGSDGRFARFDTPMHGFEAQTNLLGNYGKQGVNTINGIVNKWAPSAENGNASTQNYIATVSRELGVSPDAPLDLTDPNLRATVARAMAAVEQGHPYQIPDGTIGGYAAGANLPQPTQVAANNPSLSSNPGVANDAGSFPGGKLPWGAKTLQEAMLRGTNVMANKGFSNAPESFQQNVRNTLAQVKTLIDLQNADANLPGNKLNAEIDARQARADKLHLPADQATSYALTGDPNKMQTALQSEMDKKAAERYSGFIAEGDKAHQVVANLNQLEELNNRINKNDFAGARALVSEKFGIKIGNDVSDLNLYQSIINQLLPQMRQPGSGSTSDFDAQGFLASLPGLNKTPEGRAQVIRTLKGMAEYQIARGNIADDLDVGLIDRKEANRQLRALKASEFVSAGGNPAEANSKGQAASAQTSQQPQPQTGQQPQQQQPQRPQRQPGKPLQAPPADVVAYAQRAREAGVPLAEVNRRLVEMGFKPNF